MRVMWRLMGFMDWGLGFGDIIPILDTERKMENDMDMGVI